MSKIQVGNSPCSWGTLEFEGLRGEKIGYQQVLDELVETGYAGIELGDWGFMPTEPEILRAELDQRGLTILGAFVPIALREPQAHEDGISKAVEAAKLLAAVRKPDQEPFLILADANGTDPLRTQNAGQISTGQGLSEQEWRIFTTGAEAVAQSVSDATDLRTAFHHHCAGYVETPDEISRFLDLTDPSLLGLVIDTGHYVYGSGSSDGSCVQDALDRFSERIWHVHFKDCDPEIADKSRTEGWDYFAAIKHGVFCELGQGCVDFSAIARWLRERDYSGWIVVEQDVLPGMGTPRDSAQHNRDYLRSIGL